MLVGRFAWVVRFVTFFWSVSALLVSPAWPLPTYFGPIGDRPWQMVAAWRNNPFCPRGIKGEQLLIQGDDWILRLRFWTPGRQRFLLFEVMDSL